MAGRRDSVPVLGDGSVSGCSSEYRAIGGTIIKERLTTVQTMRAISPLTAATKWLALPSLAGKSVVAKHTFHGMSRSDLGYIVKERKLVR